MYETSPSTTADFLTETFGGPWIIELRGESFEVGNRVYLAMMSSRLTWKGKVTRESCREMGGSRTAIWICVEHEEEGADWWVPKRGHEHNFLAALLL